MWDERNTILNGFSLRIKIENQIICLYKFMSKKTITNRKFRIRENM